MGFITLVIGSCLLGYGLDNGYVGAGAFLCCYGTSVMLHKGISDIMRRENEARHL